MRDGSCSGGRIERFDARQDVQELATGHNAGAILNARDTHFLHPGADGDTSFF